MNPVIIIIFFFLLFNPYPLFSQGFNLSEEQRLRQQIRETLFVPESLPELNAEIHGKFEPAMGVVAERVTYNSLYNLKIPAIVYLPSSRIEGKIPALIIVNGHGGDKYSWYAYYAGIAYAQAGAVVLTYDPVGEGERNIKRRSGTRAHDVLLDPPEMGRHMGGLMITDVMQAVSYLSQRPEVDPNRIAVLGHSMGSFVSSLTGAVDTRIHAVVLVGGGNLDGQDGYWDNSKPMCQGIPYQSLSFLGDRPAVLFALHASRGPLLIYNGLQDSVVGIPKLGTWPFFDDLYQRTAKLHGTYDGLFEYNFTEGSHRPYFLTKPVAIWLEKKLDFPNLTESDFQAMPVTHIGEWARINGADMDRLYSSEIRAGGTIAISTGIPVLSREDLSVYSQEKWEREKHLFIYESWVKAVRKRLTNK